jgi:uncharacterized protein YndB with AHSA1/START domain
MPIKHDDSGKRWVAMEFITPGTPEQVWQAMATGPGNTAWFAKTTIDERVGGAIRFDFGPDGKSVGEVISWEPPRTFGYVERDWMPGAPPVATEITITSRSGDQCIVRMVHSLFTSSDEWDDQLEGFEGGWPGFFDVLRLYLTHFAGQPAATFRVAETLHADQNEVWSLLTGALNLAGADVGQRRQAPSEAPRLSGVIEGVHQDRKTRSIMIRANQPTDGIAALGTYEAGAEARVSISLYLYGTNASEIAESAEKEWATWLRELVEGGARALPV